MNQGQNTRSFTPSEPEMMRAALEMLSHQEDFAAAGIDAAFIELFAHNFSHIDQLPASTQETIREQFAHMAVDISYRQSVGHGRTCPEQWAALAQWFQRLNLVLTMHSIFRRAETA